jgi:hypothetical protein
MTEKKLLLTTPESWHLATDPNFCLTTNDCSYVSAGSDLVGFITIALVTLITLFIVLKWPDTFKFIFAALILRILIMLAGHYVISLPDSTQDASGFELVAWNSAQHGFFYVIDLYPGFNSFFYPWMVSIIYSLFGRSILMIQSIGLLFGIGSVLLGWLLAKKLWDNHSAMKVGWALALFPSLALYSVLPLREVYCSFFLLVAMLGMVNWIKVGGFKSIFLAMFGFYGAIHFHAVLMVGGMIFFVIVALNNLKNSLKLFLSKRISIKSFVIVIPIIFFFIAYFSNNIQIPYIGTFEDLFNIRRLSNNMEYRLTGDASYPDWTIINSSIEFIYKGIARFIYFLFSPFPWDVEKLSHFIALFDGLLYMAIVYLIYLNRKAIWKDPALRMILILLAVYIFMYGIGSSNFGASFRHRSKFVVEMIILAAPLIPKLIFLNKIKLRNIINKL